MGRERNYFSLQFLSKKKLVLYLHVHQSIDTPIGLVDKSLGKKIPKIPWNFFVGFYSDCSSSILDGPWYAIYIK